MKAPKQEKLFYSIKEVAEMFDVSQPLLRYWEKEFPSIKPNRTNKGTRQYNKASIEEIRLIYYLVKEKGHTIEGARKKLKENKSTVSQTEDVVSRLKSVKEELLKLKTEFDELDKQYQNITNKYQG
ncbi:MerR family transcriptional regulator [Bacteroidales bacterium OttesenSCG-928-I14]|nr:MerR family transcriptional regulator [Bacteroidales bacterium OttesenSCG-928-I14]